MKRLKTLLIFITIFSCCLCFVSCSPSAEEKHYEECVEKLRDTLIDPTSLLIARAESYTDKEDGDIYYKIVYNAKNKFGAYVGNNTIYFMYDAEDDEIISGNYLSTSFNLCSAFGKHTVYVD